MKKVLLTVILGLVIVVVITVLVSARLRVTQNDGKLPIVASFYPMAYFAEAIGGEKVSVKNITPAGAEPHDYDPSTQDMAAIEQARLLILHGGGLEAWGSKIAQTLQGTNVTILTAGDGLATHQIEESGVNQQDPHVWLDPVLAKQEVTKITTAIIRLDSGNRAYYQANEAKTLAMLDDLDSQYKLGLKACQRQDFVTSHAAFGYLAEEYGLNQITIAGLSPDEEPSAQDLASVARLVKARDIKYIFFESLVSSKLSDTIAQETGAKTLELNPIEGLTATQTRQGENYQTIMRHNLTNLQIALGCNQ
ncbi:MAG TPA: zinc ABC transporter substrate-binding protein [Candidatus Saccharimonadales bacterium]|nr:zinc ABC transporter substrate-binding protein [Candidatus Saccharimonadales bacterium]